MAPNWLKRGGYAPSDSPASARGAPANPWHPSVTLVKPKVRVWVTFGDDLKFGDGRARLLEAIEERGSLKQAAKAFEMSYRNAWGYLRELEQAAGFKFVERVAGGGPESGMRLTDAGKGFLRRYRTFRGALEHSTQRHFDRIFKQARTTRPTRSTR
jgi:molybdate transport system regulatory protein